MKVGDGTGEGGSIERSNQRWRGLKEEGKGGTLEKPKRCCERLDLAGWASEEVPLLMSESPLWHHDGQASPSGFNLYSRHKSTHHGMRHLVVWYLRKSGLPEGSVSCFLSLPSTAEGRPGPRTAAPLQPSRRSFPTPLQSASPGFQPYG